MNSSYPSATLSSFAEAEAAFFQLREELAGDEAGELTHAELESLVQSKGRVVLLKLFQGHLDLRSGLERSRGGVPAAADGLERPRVREAQRPLQTVVGTATVARQSWNGPSADGLRPLDAELNLPLERYSHGVRRLVAELAARMSYDEVVGEVTRQTGESVPKRQAEELAIRAAQDFETFYAQRQLSEPPPSDRLMLLSFDGKGVVVRPEDLRPATKRVAEKKKVKKLNHRLSSGEKHQRKRMAEVAAVWTAVPQVRGPEDIVRVLRGTSDSPEKRPKVDDKRVWASLEQEPAQVIEAAFQEALRRDPLKARKWVVLVDGNDSQVTLVAAAAKRHGVHVALVLDIIHVIEYLWKIARALSSDSDTDNDNESWVTAWLLRLLSGKVSDLVRAQRGMATTRDLSPEKRKVVLDATAYLLNHKEMTRYHDYLAAGFPIASGVIEGACRHLICDRMDITGARWSLTGAEAVLRLRALRASRDFEAYWDYHLRQELHRNHLHLYAANDNHSFRRAA